MGSLECRIPYITGVQHIPCPAPVHGHLGHEVVPALLLPSLVIPVCSATFPDVIGSSDSRLEQCFAQLGIGKLDWSLPSTPHASSLSMRYTLK